MKMVMYKSFFRHPYLDIKWTSKKKCYFDVVIMESFRIYKKEENGGSSRV
jgi:hypothetical protein